MKYTISNYDFIAGSGTIQTTIVLTAGSLLHCKEGISYTTPVSTSTSWPFKFAQKGIFLRPSDTTTTTWFYLTIP